MKEEGEDTAAETGPAKTKVVEYAYRDRDAVNAAT